MGYTITYIILGPATGTNLSPMVHENMTHGPKWPVKILDGAKFYPDCTKIDQSIENTGVAFVKGADERNKLFEKINDQ